MGIKIAFVATQSDDKHVVFPITSGGLPFFATGKQISVFPITQRLNNFFSTGGKTFVWPLAIGSNNFFSTSGRTLAFPVTACINTSKLLKLKFDPFDLATDYSSITAFDGTGEYDATTNPDGYNPPADPTDPNRAKRTEVDLYLGIRIWQNSQTVPVVFFPGVGSPQLDPYEYLYPINNNYGVYQFYLVGAPVGTLFSYIQALGNDIFAYASCQDGWYVTTSTVIVDPSIYLCINNFRYKFLESVMCGCCEGPYLEMYSWLVGALNAFDIGTNDAIIDGMKLLEKIKEVCNKEDCNNNCGGNNC